MNETITKLRTVKSFVRRLGHLSERQKEILSFAHKKNYFKQDDINYFVESFYAQYQSYSSHALDIGFGDGKTLVEMATEDPDCLVIGVEPHKSGVATALLEIERLSVKNIIIYEGDIHDLLGFFDDKLDRVHLYFPDPWPKKRHFKRRIVQQEFLSSLSRALKSKGKFYCATDWAPYASYIQDQISRSGNFYPAQMTFKRALTKYEMRGHRLNHKIYDFCWSINKDL